MSTLRTNNLQNPDSSSVNIELTQNGGAVFSGVTTFSSDLNIAGVLTYEDVTNIDSVGVITARDGIHVTGGSVGIGTDNPTQKLTVSDVISIKGAPGGSSQVLFSDTDSDYAGRLFYNHTTNALQFFVNTDERLRITSDGLVGVDHQNPTAGLSIGKYGTQPVPNGNTYPYPAGNWSTVWNTTTANSTDYWVGFAGGYNVSSANVHISLAPNSRDFNEQAGIYIAGEATAGNSADFTVGKIISGSVAGVSTVAGTQRATKTEMFRIDSSGRMTLPYQPAFMVRGAGGGSITANSKFTFTSTPSAGTDNAKACFDRGGNWSDADDRFTAPVAGAYHFYFRIYRQSSTSSIMSIAPRLNGNQIVIGDNLIFFTSATGETGNTDDGDGGSFTLNLSAGDFVELYMRNGANTITWYAGHSFFGGHLIG